MLDRSPKARGRDRMRTTLARPADPLAVALPDAFRSTAKALTVDSANGAGGRRVRLARARERAAASARRSARRCGRVESPHLSGDESAGWMEWRGEPARVPQSAIGRRAPFLGMTDATMSTAKSWHSSSLGAPRARRRDGRTARICVSDAVAPGQHASAEWLGISRAGRLAQVLFAFEAYCQPAPAHVRPHRVAEFIVFNAEFASLDSLRRRIVELPGGAATVSKLTAARNAGRAERLAVRLRASLNTGRSTRSPAGDLPAPSSGNRSAACQNGATRFIGRPHRVPDRTRARSSARCIRNTESGIARLTD